ncbi:type VI secretion system baseplate subunit TssF [Jannaschia pohangensis]|uniref:Type VI secretion system protein ImpG n=1 Tax=Jannaschia pohangensis TaxID=390807 RepID=A0A1I3ULE5_9RHOB|nr:type VI secretion system baseplate subunit TssF [Jannaschia pohangensis]SFJ83513.1 type VI secretion system protein ImpG [Jannaschia pohangensis]
MKKDLRRAYDRELALLRERAAEFAADYPGIADRLGGLLHENLDPAVAGLLEGTAFLAARVHLKMEDEFKTFTEELLDQIFPEALEPTPSAMMVQANPPWDNSGLVDGLRFNVGDYLDARYVEADQRVTCRFRLSEPLTLWPLALTRLVYHPTPGPVGALGQDVTPDTRAGLEIDLSRLGPAGETASGLPLSGLPIKTLPIHFTAPMAEAAPLYEQMFCDVARVSLRWIDAHGDAAFRRLPPDAIGQVGFDPGAPLFPMQGNLFEGFALLREAFTFPRKILGFTLCNLDRHLAGIPNDSVTLVIEFKRPSQVLAARLELEHLRLHTVPAINLFEEGSNQVRLDAKRHEFVVTPDASPVTHYEVHRITDVYAHYAAQQQKVRVHPLYSLPPEGQEPSATLYFTTRRKPRRLTAKERRFGTGRARYRGTETYISVYEPPEVEGAQRLQIKTLCSNRHLAEYLPIASGKDDFHLCEDQTVSLSCVAGPTPPRGPLVDMDQDAGHRANSGQNYWRLISYLSLSHHGLGGQRDSAKAAAALRELLSIFSNISDTVTMPRLQAITDVKTRPITRTIEGEDGFHPARGLEVTLTIDETPFDPGGVIVLTAIIERFLAEYAAVNTFTQCVVVSKDRGHIKTWPPRTGQGPLL